jgi:hypothetical protein
LARKAARFSSAFAAFLRADYEKNGAAARRAGLKAA